MTLLAYFQVILAQCVVYLSRASKSVEVYSAYDKAKKCVRSHQGPLPSVPLHLRNAPTKLMKDLGKDFTNVHRLISSLNIWIKHRFSCINFCQVPRELLKIKVFNLFWRDPTNVNVWKNHI